MFDTAEARSDEATFTADFTELRIRYGHYGYRRTTVCGCSRPNGSEGLFSDA